MKQTLFLRSVALLLMLVLLLSYVPLPAFAQEEEPKPDTTRASQSVVTKANALKTKIQSLPTSGSEWNVRVDLTGYAPTTAEGDPIYGLRGMYYVAYLQDGTAKVLDGSWGDSVEKNAPLPTVPVTITGNSLNTASVGRDISFTMLPADIFNGIGRHVFAFANKTLTGSNAEVYQLAADVNKVAVLDANNIDSAPRILCRKTAGDNTMELLYSNKNGTQYTLCIIDGGETPTFGWIQGITGPSFALYRIWSTVKLRNAITNVTSILNNPDNYNASEYENFLSSLEKGITVFQTYNTASTNLIAPNVYPQEEMDRLAEEIESYKTLLDKNKSYIDIPVEIMDFRSDGYLFENTANYAFRYDYRDAENTDLGQTIIDDIVKRFGNLPELPGQLATPVYSNSGANNMRVGLTEQSLVNGKLVYKQGTIEYMAHSLCKKSSVNSSSSLAYYVAGSPQTLEEFIDNTIYKPYNATNATEAQKAAILGTWEQTLDKIGGENGNSMTWSQVETAMDAAYYLLTYLWQPVSESDTFYYDGSNMSPDTSLTDQAYNRYNMVVKERDTLRLYGNSSGVYTLNSSTASSEMGYSGRYAFTTSGKSNVIKVTKPGFAPIDGLGFEAPGIMTANYDTDPGSGRVVIEGHNGYDSNYNFSMHAYGSFIYYEDQNLYFDFKGDDDVYFFINGDMALDIGSSHAAKTGRCNLNDFVDQKGNKLENGRIYTFDMFYTERATPDANLTFTTNIKIVDDKALTTKGQYLEIHGKENRVNSTTGMGVPQEENAAVAIGDTVAYSFELLNTRTVPLTNVSFTDNTLGVDISKDHLKLCDSANNYTLNNGAKTLITDIVVTYRTYNSNKFDQDELTMVPYRTMLPRIQGATAEPTGSETQFKQLDPGSYGVRISSESELKTLLELGIPVNCQMAVYGFKRIMILEDQPYRNTVQSLAYYRRVDGTGLVYGDPIPVSGTADRTIRISDPNTLAAPQVEAERYVIDYNKPLEISIENLTKHIYSTKYVPIGDIVGFVTTGTNGGILRRLPENLCLESSSGSKAMETTHGTVTREGDLLTYSLNGFLSEIDRFYAVVEVFGLVIDSTYNYPYILVEIQIIPATTMYYETDLASKEFSNEETAEGLYFDFKNTAADQKRYASPIYGNANFDDTNTVHWKGSVDKIQVFNADEGTLVVDAKYVAETQEHPGFSLDASVKGKNRDYLLNYKVKQGDVLQVRLKMENFVSKGGNPYLSLHPTYDGTKKIDEDTKSRKDFDEASYVYDGKYHIVTSTLTDENFSYTTLDGLRIYFGNMNSQSDTVRGKLTIDYIYVGPADRAPVGEHLYFDFTNRESDQDRYNAPLYGSRYFYNYDTAGAWRHRTSTLQSSSTDTSGEGKLILTTKDDTTLHGKDANGNALNNEAWIQASPQPKASLNMNYHPKEGDVLLIRLRMFNIEKADGKTFGVRPAFHAKRTEDVNTDLLSLGTHSWPSEITSGEYTYFRLELWKQSNYLKEELLTSFRLTFTGLALTDPSLGYGQIEIDYIYIGQEKDFARMEELYGQNWQTVTDGTTHTGEVQESDFVNRTVYDLEAWDDSKRFFLGFENTQEDKDRYSTPTYNNKNRDELSGWGTSGLVSDHEMDNDLGLYTLIAKPTIKDTDYPSVHADINGLSFVPKDAEVYQVRFKLENFVLGEYTEDNVDKTCTLPYVDLHYKYDSSTSFSKIADTVWLKSFDPEYITNGQYVTMTLDLTDTFRNASTIHTMRFYFGAIESPGNGTSGRLTIDYIYIGPRDRAPANTTYGYDLSYDNDTKLSNGSSLYVEGTGVRVNGTETNYTETLFSFTGTGFDIISRTGSQQGTLRVSVFSDSDRTKLVKALTVNNKGELELYQIPVASIQDLPHGTYYVTIGVNKKITGSPYEMLNRGNQFYFDAIRIYDPMDITDDTELQTVYRLDKELDPRVKEVRNILLSSAEFESLLGSSEGAIFIDSYEKETITVTNPETGKTEIVDDPNISINNHYALTVQTYNKVGPKNEVYLSPGQAVAFRLKMHSSSVPVSLDIGAKTINGTATKLVAGIVTASAGMDDLLAVETATRKELTTATAMYYPLNITAEMIPSDRNCYIVIMNGSDETDPRNGDYVLSITDIKVCYGNLLTQTLPEDDINDPEIAKRTATEEEPFSFLVDENTPKAAAFFMKEELSLPLEVSDTTLLHSLSLTDSIALNYAVAKKDLENCENVHLEVKLPRYTGSTLTGSETLTLLPVEKGDYYYFTLTSLTAVTMMDTLEATLYYTTEGTSYKTEPDLYSIADYAYNQLRKEGLAKELKTLCADLLNYGARAQLFKGYRTDTLATAQMTSEEQNYLTDPDTVTFDGVNTLLDGESTPVLNWVGKALDLGSTVATKYIFSLGSYEGAVEALTLHISYENLRGQTVTMVLSDPVLYNTRNGYYAFTLKDLPVAELRAPVCAQIFCADTPLSQTLQYSAAAYGEGKTGTLGDLCTALMAYSDSARAYFLLLNNK